MVVSWWIVDFFPVNSDICWTTNEVFQIIPVKHCCSSFLMNVYFGFNPVSLQEN